MMRHGTWVVALGMMVGALAPTIAGARQGQDHPLIGRYAGSELLQHRHSEFDEYRIPLGPLEDGEYGRLERVEGKVTWIGYRNPDGRSTLEIFRNYQQQLESEGFDEVWRCESADACGYWFADRLFDADPKKFLHAADTGADEGIRYVVAKRSGGGGTVYAQITVYDDGNDVWTRVRVIESEAMESDRIEVVQADEMARRIAEQGSVALYGIYFDTDSANIRAESKATLEQIARLLRNDPDLRLLVVGHTDSRGGFDYNIDLSRRRAAAVIDALVEDHGIERARLRPWGVGFAAPAATNATEAGRAKNRRVELVQR